MSLKKIDHATLAERFAPLMFALSLAFLILLGALIVVWVDIPRFEWVGESLDNVTTAESDSNNSPSTHSIGNNAAYLGKIFVYILIGLWTIIACEVLLQLYLSIRAIEIRNENRWRVFALLQCLCPPLRLAAPNIAKAGCIWLPIIGWSKPSRKLFKNLQSAFSKPMLFFALLILPILLVEFALHRVVESQLWLRLTIHVCTGLIWCAFAIEFIVLVSASPKRLQYVKKNWIDLAIILLPLILFLRSLRALRLMRLAKFAKVQQIVQISRVYRVRGVAMKVMRAMMVLEVFSRVFGGSPSQRLKRLNEDLKEKLEEVDEIKQEIAKVEFELAKLENTPSKSREHHS